MKLDALDHPKTLDLASRLGVKRPAVIGHLELLWAWTGKNAPQGNLGKWPDGAIAEACYWEGDPTAFVQALIGAGLLDRHPVHRLLVHDWSQHAQSWVRMKLKKMGLDFIKMPIAEGNSPGDLPIAEGNSPGDLPIAEGNSPGDLPIAEGNSPGDLPIAEGNSDDVLPTTRARASQAKPILAKPSQAKPPERAGVGLDPDRNPDNPEPWRDIVAGYPEGTYEQKSFLIGEREARRRVTEGFTWSELAAGVKRMSDQKWAQGKIGTQFVPSPAKFFAPDPDLPGSFPFQGEFKLPRSKAQSIQDSNVAAGLAFLAESKP